MAIYKCTICNYNYDEDKEAELFNDLPDGWMCPICNAGKSIFIVEQTTTNTEPIEQTISDLVIETMINWGVTTVFGMVGHSNLGLAEAIRKQCKNGRLTYYGIRHEGAAAFAASAYGKLTGKPAACLTIAGPGATNLMTGLWDAKMDRAPLLALTGQVDIQYLGPGAFQEIDLSSAFDAVAGFSQTVLETSNHSELMALALKHAIGKRDVAHLIFPNSVQTINLPEKAHVVSPEGRLAATDIAPSEDSVKKATRLIRKASAPVIILGNGSKEAVNDIVSFAETLNIPMMTTFRAKGFIPDSHPLACGVLGLSGTPISSHYMNESDLLIVLGASFARHTGILTEKATIQVDFDTAALGKFHSISCPVWGEIKTTLDQLSRQLSDMPGTPDAKPDPRNTLKKHWQNWRDEKTKRSQLSNDKGLSSAAVFKALSEYAPPDAVISVDVGNSTYSFGRYFECKNQRVLMSGYLGSIGYGYPSAIGAFAAEPSRPNLVITGDGGFVQYMGELLTAVKYKMPIKHILLNNSELGKISNEQRHEGIPVWSTELHNPDFSAYAENCGALGLKAIDEASLRNGLKDLFEHNGPGCLEIITDPALV